ncbi:MAG TPA: AraC family transcriptional regulator, partial [Caulobacteraceae bacterium]
QACRLYLAQKTATGVGWLYALREPQISIAIEAIHRRPAHPWTLDELARLAVMSRSTFARRFRERVGDTPIAYLARWRMLLATRRLIDSRDTLSEIALSLGYDSENAFNTAFKRIMGCSPRRYSQVEPALTGTCSATIRMRL